MRLQQAVLFIRLALDLHVIALTNKVHNKNSSYIIYIMIVREVKRDFLVHLRHLNLKGLIIIMVVN